MNKNNYEVPATVIIGLTGTLIKTIGIRMMVRIRIIVGMTVILRNAITVGLRATIEIGTAIKITMMSGPILLKSITDIHGQAYKVFLSTQEYRECQKHACKLNINK